MLSKADNELLTHVGPGTPMGDVIRRYWIPFYLSSELEADGPPARVRLLGEDLIAFRDSAGRVGLMGDHCPHRGASLFFGRNEEKGLRCVYHGWKFDLAGNCVDMPNEPAESNFKHKIRHTAYPCRERNGMLWTYMGPLAEPPELPALEWNTVPEHQVYYSIRIAENNFMQAIEGEYDSTHIGFLHQGLDPASSNTAMEQLYMPNAAWGFTGLYSRLDKAPRFETVDTEYGVLIGTRRDAPDDSYYWRIYPFIMPFHTLIPPQGARAALQGHAWVPMDDEHTICICFAFHPDRPLREQEVHALRYGMGDGLEGLHPSVDIFHVPDARPYAGHWPRLENGNDFGFDYEAQRSNQRFSGLPGTWPQDSGMQQSMGPIYDRTKEHLGVADTGQIHIRRRMLQAARALRDKGQMPPGAEDPQACYIRSTEAVLPRRVVDWVGAVRESMRAGRERITLIPVPEA